MAFEDGQGVRSSRPTAGLSRLGCFFVAVLWGAVWSHGVPLRLIRNANMNKQLYICIYTYTYLHVFFIWVYTYSCINKFMQPRVHTHTHTRTFVCIGW